MSTTNDIVDFLESLSCQPGSTEEESDACLISDFLENRSESSLIALVQRHGAMVYRLCLRSLGHCQDAEDAFQATFLVLALKARSIRKKASVASWLHGVAYRVASRLRQKRTTVRNHEVQVEELPDVASSDTSSKHRIDHRIDQELAMLPGKLKEAIVLCDLEGLTQREAAQRCGCPEGTMSARLTRGRRLLANRLSQKDIAVGTGLLAMLLRPRPGAAMSYRLLSSTAQGALAHVTGAGTATGLLSANAISLAQGACQTMFLSKKNLAIVVLAMVGIVGTAVSMVLQHPQGETGEHPKRILEADSKESPNRDDPTKKAVQAEPSFRYGSTQFRWGGRVSSLEYSPDGKRLLSAGSGWGAAVWSAETGKLIRHFPYFGAWTTASFSSDGKHVVLAGYHLGPVPVLDIDSGKQISVIKKGSKTARFSADGRIVFTVLGNRLAGFDAASGEPLPRFAGLGEGDWMIAAAPKGTLVAVNSHLGDLWVWDWKTRKLVAQTTGIGTGIHNAKDLEFTPDGRSLIVFVKGKGVELRDARKLTVIRRFSTGRAGAVGISRNGKRLAVSSHASSWVTVFDLQTGKKIRSWEGHFEHVSSVALSPDGKRLACGTDYGGAARIWDVATAKELFPTQGHQATIGRLTVLKDGSVIAHDHTSLLGRWDPTTEEPTEFWKWPWPRYMAARWAFSPKAGRTLIGNKSLYLGADLRDPKNTYTDVFAKASPPNKKSRIVTIAMSADGRYGAAATMDDRVCVCDLSQLTHVGTVTLPKKRHVAWNRHYSLALSPDGGVLAGSSEDEARLWDVKTGKVLPSPRAGFHLHHLAFSPDGGTLALAGSGKVMIWDVKRRRTRMIISPQKHGVRSIAFSPDSAMLATGSRDIGDIAQIWNLATGREIWHLRGARGGAAALAFSPDGRTLYAGTGSSLIVGWHLRRK